MYRDHVPIIAEAFHNGAPILTRACLFSILSARQQFVTLPDQLASFDRDGLGSEFLFSWKRGAAQYVIEHELDLWCEIKSIPLTECGRAIDTLCRVPGLGIVKAAFVLQMIGFDIACLDVRNVKREGRNPRAFRSDGESRKHGLAWQRKIARYVKETAGKAEHYWDTWCRDVASVYDMTAEDVSAIHLLVAENA